MKILNFEEFTLEQAQAELRRAGIELNHKHNMSQVGGMKPLLDLISRGKFRDSLEKELGQYKSRTVIQLLVGLWTGARSMVEVGQAGKDPLLARVIKRPVEEAQLARDLKSFTKAEIEALHDVNRSHVLFHIIQKLPPDEVLYLDVDSTHVEKYGEQEGVEKGYCGRDQIENCYQYLLFYLNNQRMFLCGTIRSGSTHSQNDFCGYLERLLPSFKRRRRLCLRGDTGYYNEKAFDVMSENDVSFFIKAPMTPSRSNQVLQSQGALVWSLENAQGVSYATDETKTEQGSRFREVFKRTRLTSSQASLFEALEYRYDCVATNDFAISEDEVFLVYNGRAQIENGIKELKEDYQLGRIVTDSFDANDVITQVSLMAYTILQVFKSEVLPPKMSRNRLSTLRTHVFHVPGCLVHWARRQIMRIQNVFSSEQVLGFIQYRSRVIQSWALDPPIFET